jgi:signal transduction histidine kinase
VRLTYQYETFFDEFVRFRFIIGIVLLMSLIVGIGFGSILAININSPIRQVTQAVYDLASGKRSERLPERGPQEIRQLQHAANHLVERLRNLEESRRKLLANLVHELGRPLGSLRAAIQALQRGAKDNPELLEEFLRGMEHEALLLQRVTEDLSHLHEQVLGPLEMDYRAMDLTDWLPMILRPWQASAQERRLRWVVEIPENLPTIRADGDRLAQAIGNLVSNAIKYTPTGGVVTVSAGVKDTELWIRVQDTGPGIPPDEMDKIFTPFYRGTQGKRFPQGMGLGLSIAHDLIAAHGGKIDVQSTPGLGSIFTIWLPLQS